jgi:hypothetical protein
MREHAILPEDRVALREPTGAKLPVRAAGVTNRDTSSDRTMDVTAISTMILLAPESGRNAGC